MKAFAQLLAFEATYRAWVFGDAKDRDPWHGPERIGDGFTRPRTLRRFARAWWWFLVTGRQKVPKAFWPPCTQAEIEDSWQSTGPIPVKTKFMLVAKFGRLGFAHQEGDTPAHDQKRVVDRFKVRDEVREIQETEPEEAVLLDHLLEQAGKFIAPHQINDWAEKKRRERYGDESAEVTP